MYTVGISETLQDQMQAERTESNIMGKDDFLELLIQQMKHQDPMEPMSNTEYAAQLAQYSSLEQLQQLNESAESQIVLGQSLNNSFMTSLIDREVKSFGNGIEFNGTAVDLHYNLSRSATDLDVKIYDENDNLVRTLDGDGALTGDQSISWDGKNSSGDLVEEGSYHFEVSAADDAGNNVSVQTYMVGIVNGITYSQGSPYMNINGQFVNLGDIISISTNSDNSSDSANTNDNSDENSSQNSETSFANRIINRLTRGLDGQYFTQ